VSNRIMLAVIAGACVVNGLYLDRIPPWRQLLFAVLVVVAYLHGRHRPARFDWLVPALAAVPGVVFLGIDAGRGAGALMGLGLFVVLPWLAGRFRRQQADLVVAGRERIAQLEREQELVAEQARLRERAHIAADMHDSLGHELALIALRAGALELAADLTPANQEAVAALRASAVTATDRLRRTVSLLRTPQSRASIEPPDESVAALVDRARAAGMAVALDWTQPPGAPSEALPRSVDRAVHRVVQEALTNAARHAPGAEVLVDVRYDPDEVVVTVRDQGAAGVPGGAGGGSGLVGLRERVRLLGGTLRAGPHGGGFAVTARIPRLSHGGEVAG
jgi:signal transduction histidine kinase